MAAFPLVIARLLLRRSLAVARAGQIYRCSGPAAQQCQSFLAIVRIKPLSRNTYTLRKSSGASRRGHGTTPSRPPSRQSKSVTTSVPGKSPTQERLARADEMPKSHNKTGRSKNEGRFVALPHNIMDTYAWRHLSGNARGAWLEFVRVYRGRGSNNGGLAMSSRTLAERLNICKSRAALAIKELITYGFLEPFAAAHPDL
jgi:hypothetical protein